MTMKWTRRVGSALLYVVDRYGVGFLLAFLLLLVLHGEAMKVAYRTGQVSPVLLTIGLLGAFLLVWLFRHELKRILRFGGKIGFGQFSLETPARFVEIGIDKKIEISPTGSPFIILFDVLRNFRYLGYHIANESIDRVWFAPSYFGHVNSVEESVNEFQDVLRAYIEVCGKSIPSGLLLCLTVLHEDVKTLQQELKSGPTSKAQIDRVECSKDRVGAILIEEMEKKGLGYS